MVKLRRMSRTVTTLSRVRVACPAACPERRTELTCMNAGYQRNALDRLNADWSNTQSSPYATDQIQRWSYRWLALSGSETPEDVLKACYRFDDSTDAVLLTLLRIVHGRYEGRDLAARL